MRPLLCCDGDDPAMFLGNSESGAIMTAQFRGFGNSFLMADPANCPWMLDKRCAGHSTASTRVLIHFNLFDSGYLSKPLHVIDALLAEYC